MDRRRDATTPQTPMVSLERLPAMVVLERLPVPALAIGPDGAILFTNGAFAAMIGRAAATVLTMSVAEVFHGVPKGEAAVPVVRARADSVVELVHADGTTVRARMSESALLRGDDAVILATFQDLTEQLWVEEL